MRIFVRAVSAIAWLAIPAASSSQPSQSPAASPYIAASAVGETRVTPDRAIVQVTVDSRAESAASAGVQNRDKQERVIAAVKAEGVAAPQIHTSAYRVNPEYGAPERGRPPRVTGYHATNTILVEVRSIENIGKVIDAALSAGATNIGSVGLYASSTDAARREAVELAVTKARGEAQSAAAAAGGTLGTLVELTIDPGAIPRPLLHNVVATGAISLDSARESGLAPSYTPVEPGESLVIAMVRARWQFVPAPR
ncbi:MAG: SIMPL domain-containing protein [Gemmatimonadaceae bacterium]